MSYSVALAGKGGTGKTTMAGMLIKYLLKKEKTPIATTNPNKCKSCEFKKVCPFSLVRDNET